MFGSIRRSVGLKILLAVGIVGSVTLTSIGLFAVLQMEISLHEQHSKDLLRFTDGVSQGLQTIMLAGYADIAHDYADNLTKVEGLISFNVLRTSGLAAFQDNQTIDEVNTRIGEEEFNPREEEKELRVLPQEHTALQEATSREATVSYNEQGETGDNQITFLVPVKNAKTCFRCHGGDHTVRGILKLTTSLAAVEGEIARTRLQLLVGVVSSVAAFLLFIGFLLRRLVNRPLLQIGRTIQEMADGNLIDRVPDPKSGDEMTSIAGNVNRMADSLVHNIRTINMHSGSITAFVMEILSLRKNLGEDSENLREIAHDVDEENRRLVAEIIRIQQDVNQAVANIGAISNASGQVSEVIGSMAGRAMEANDNVGTMARSAEQMRTNVLEVNQNLERTNNEVAAVVREMSGMAASLEGVRQQCREASRQSGEANQSAHAAIGIASRLAESAREIGKVTSLIRQIADKTNLLALNAAIEAAGAGEHGRGFAVVAGEVKELAQQTAEATKSIEARVQGVRQDVGETAQAVERITGMVAGILAANEAIAHVMDSQADSIRAVNRSMEEVSRSAREMTESGQELGTSALHVSQAAAEAAAGTQAIVQASDSAVQESQAMAERSAQASDFMGAVLAAANTTQESAGVVREKVKRSLAVVSYMQGSVNHFRSLGDVASNISDALHAAQSSLDVGPERFDIRRMKEVHLNLLGKLERAANGSLSLSSQEVPKTEECPLGQWILNEGEANYNDNDTFSRMKETHQQLHATAHEVLGHIADGHQEGAVLAVRFFQELRKSLFDQLDLLYMAQPGQVEEDTGGPLVVWSDDLSVESTQLDEDHKGLLEMINTLHRAALHNEGTRILGQTIAELVSYAESHFAREEKWMAEHGYPDLAAHRQQHEAFIRKVSEHHTLFRNENLPFSMDILNFMKNWLLIHIRGSDGKYRDYIASKRHS